jgi:hypothetical protein
MKPSTDPLDALNSLFPSFLATSLAHSFTTVRDIRRFLALPLTNCCIFQFSSLCTSLNHHYTLDTCLLFLTWEFNVTYLERLSLH